MIGLVTPAQMRVIEAHVIKRTGIPSILLMENAARAVAKDAARGANNVAVVCGMGNNGGDGLAAARWLAHMGIPTRVYVLGNGTLKEDAQKNFDIAKAYGVEITRDEDIDDFLFGADVIIDAIFGSGLNKHVAGEELTAIRAINARRECGCRIISVDIPSGIDGATGQVLGATVKAHRTVTFGMPKFGHYLYPGRDYTGELITADICVSGRTQAQLIEPDDLVSFFGRRKRNTHKGDYGKLAIIGGASGMEGAAQMAGIAALRSGCGMVTLGVPQTAYTAHALRPMELMAKPLSCLDNGGFDGLGVLLKDKQCLAIGPGLGRSEHFRDILKHILATYTIRTVIDADGLYALGEPEGLIGNGSGDVILTPHMGEMSRLTGLPAEEIGRDIAGYTAHYAEKWGTVLLLKGATTVIAAPDGRLTFNITGSPGMATAGSGDVLTGIISALICRGFSPFDAAGAAACLHGLAGENAAAARGEHGMTAGDIISTIMEITSAL